MIIGSKKSNGYCVSGKITRNPETRSTPNGGIITKFSVLYGQDETTTDDNGRHPGKFMDVDVWGSQGEITGSILQKGDSVAVFGRLRSREYEGKTYWSITADVILPDIAVINAIIPPDSSSAVPAQSSAPIQAPEFEELDDDGDVPF